MPMTDDLPPLALSVRQPWAWAILHAGKEIENRSLGAIRSGRMDVGRIALHAASGMTRKEYDWALWRMTQDGISVPLPSDLPRRAIVGSVEVSEIVTESDSPWFGGKSGLRLRQASPVKPIAAPGALGFFRWSPGGALAPTLAWMETYAPPGLFDTLPRQFRKPPEKPFGTEKA
ncbi:MAG: hypothetical protein AAGF88_01640 [Pseudomonadota bacterium]